MLPSHVGRLILRCSVALVAQAAQDLASTQLAEAMHVCDSMRAMLTRERRKSAGLFAEKAELEKQVKAFDDKLAASEKEVSRHIGHTRARPRVRAPV